jgi:light-regulated signal transduction histidine kinase (bacteriophytochrome)
VEVDAALRLRTLVMDLVVSHAEQLAELNADLARSNEELDAFAYVASHDLKEPLRGIHKYAHHLLEEARAAGGLGAQAEERLQTLLRLTVRMDGLLDALLHFSRVGRLELAREPIPFSEIIHEAVEMLGARMLGEDVEIRILEPMPTITCDRVQVREVLSNLLGNAIKYNEAVQKRVEVGCLDVPPPSAPAEVAGQRTFFVRDNGIGIAPKHQQQIFRMFKRLHGRAAFGGGTGAGLAIASKLVERHGGKMWLESTPGEGTTFHFTLGPEAAR